MFCGLRKKRETDSERQMETHGARRKRGEKKKRDKDAKREETAARWRPLKKRRGNGGVWGEWLCLLPVLSLLTLHVGLQRVCPTRPRT